MFVYVVPYTHINSFVCGMIMTMYSVVKFPFVF